MRSLAMNICLVVAFLMMLVAKVFEIGGGASLSWWIVTSPIWAPPLLFLMAVVILLAVAKVTGTWTPFIEGFKTGINKRFKGDI